jgi:hypothetical protein
MSGRRNKSLTGIWALTGIRRFVGLRSAGRRSFALEPLLKPRKNPAECLQQARDCASNDCAITPPEPRGAGCCHP